MPLMLLLGGLYPLVPCQQSAVSPEQLVGSLSEVTGEELAARFGMSDRGTAVAGPTSYLLLADLSAFTQGSQLAAEGAPQGRQFRSLQAHRRSRRPYVLGQAVQG
jgi:hypothetical protein